MSSQPQRDRVARLEGAYEQFDKRLGDLISTMESRFAQIDGRFAQVESHLDGLRLKIDGLQWRMTSLIVVTWVTTILAILLKH